MIMTPQPRLETVEAAATETLPAEPYPWLIYCQGENQTFITATPKSSSSSSGCKIYERSIPELRNKTIMVCCHGWLLLSDQTSTHHYSLWNPSTMQSIVIPPLKLSRSFVVGSRVLSSPPDKSSSTIILFEQSQSAIIFLRIGRGHQQWIERQCGEQLGVEISHDHDKIVYAICCSEQVYVTTCYGQCLMKLDIVDDEEDMNKIIITPLVQLPLPQFKDLLHTRYFVESLGQLFLICLIHSGVSSRVIHVEAHKLDLGEKRWEKVGTIQDQVFFLGIRNSVSCSGLSDLDRGSMYFSGGSYNIVDKSLSDAFNKDVNLPQSASSHIWVMPNHHRIHDNPTNGIGEVDMKVPEEEEVKKTSDYEEDSKETTLVDLPQCILGEISRQLAFLDYMNLRAVCRVLSKAAPVSEWRKTSEEHSLPPWLMLCNQGSNEYTFIDPKFGGRYFIRTPDQLSDTSIYCVKDGWLLMMSRDDNSMFFFNPFTKAILTCPPLSLGYQAINYIMSLAPSCSNNLVMAITTEEAGVRQYIIGNGDEQWQYMDYPTATDFVPHHNSPVVTDGFYHFLGQKGNILILSREDDCWFYEVNDELQALCQSFCDFFLVECNESTHAIFVGDQGKWVRVFVHEVSSDVEDEDELTMIWLEVESIGKWTMFLSRSSCLSVETEYEEMGDRIYFPRLHKGSLVFYSLKTGKFHRKH